MHTQLLSQYHIGLAAGVIIASLLVIVLLGSIALISRINDAPKWDGRERRSRHRCRQHVAHVQSQIASGALNVHQATYRLREIEAPADAAQRAA